MSTIRGFKLDSESHDLYLDASGDLESIVGDAATAQEAETRFLFFQGESFTDTREGVPWFQEILAKGVDDARVRAIVRRVLLSLPTVIDVPVVEITRDPQTRHATIRWEARDRTGATIRSEDYGPLVIPGPVLP